MKALEEYLYQRQVTEAARSYVKNKHEPVTVRLFNRHAVGRVDMLEDLESIVQAIVNERMDQVMKVAIQRLEKKENQMLLAAKSEVMEAVKTIETCEAEGLTPAAAKEESHG